MNKSIKSIVKVSFLILIVNFVSCKGGEKSETDNERRGAPRLY